MGVRECSKACLHADTREMTCWRGSEHACVSGKELCSLQAEGMVASDIHLLRVRRSLVSCQATSDTLAHVQHEMKEEGDEGCRLSWKARRSDRRETCSHRAGPGRGGA